MLLFQCTMHIVIIFFFFVVSYVSSSESVGSGGTKLTVLNLEILSYKDLHDKL